MWKVRDTLVRFMTGRYGVDKLCYALLVLYLILAVINMFLNNFPLMLISYAILICTFFRALSKNIPKRYAENLAFLKLWGKVTPWVTTTVNRIKEIRTKVYHKCPHCKATLRLPRRKGKHTVSCPKCHKDFQLKVWLKSF